MYKLTKLTKIPNEPLIINTMNELKEIIKVLKITSLGTYFKNRPRYTLPIVIDNWKHFKNDEEDFVQVDHESLSDMTEHELSRLEEKETISWTSYKNKETLWIK